MNLSHFHISYLSKVGINELIPMPEPQQDVALVTFTTPEARKPSLDVSMHAKRRIRSEPPRADSDKSHTPQNSGSPDRWVMVSRIGSPGTIMVASSLRGRGSKSHRSELGVPRGRDIAVIRSHVFGGLAAFDAYLTETQYAGFGNSGLPTQSATHQFPSASASPD
jgi:hypothetical protein